MIVNVHCSFFPRETREDIRKRAIPQDGGTKINVGNNELVL